MRLGLLTGGGDCPGLNAVIRAVVRDGAGRRGAEIVAFRDGWHGVLENRSEELVVGSVRGIIHRGGTIIGSSGTNPFNHERGEERIAETFAAQRLDGLIAVGGEGTLTAASRLADRGLKIVGVPKTIDNDLSANDFTIGFHTAVGTATDAIDRLHSTAESHNRVMVVEVMGRNAGWIAMYSGIAGGADAVLIPERSFDLDEICARLRKRHLQRSSFSIVVVAEGATPIEGSMNLPSYELDENGFERLGGISTLLGPELQARTGFETRVTILGHTQRGGSPVPFDRVLGTRLGIAAVGLAEAGGWGRMAALQGGEIVDVALADAVAERKVVPDPLIATSEVFCS
ncbi:MAG: ATP-dependent 6-phosphofructokinase [Actinomycetota bacterium]